MAPNIRPKSPATVVLDPADPRWADVVESFAEAERGEGITLTPEEAEHYAATGELPRHAHELL
jgi:hypothetical protein